MRGVIAFVLLVGVCVADIKYCEGYYKDLTLEVNMNDVEEIHALTREGIIVVEETNAKTNSVNISVLLRITATDKALLDTFNASLFFDDYTINVVVCPIEGSDENCYSDLMLRSPAPRLEVSKTNKFLMGAFATVVGLWGTNLYIGPPGAHAQEFVEDCATSAITVKIPKGWRGDLQLKTETGDIAFNNAVNATSLDIETWTGSVASVWEAPIEIDNELTIKAHDKGSTVYFARVTMTGNGERDCSVYSAGNGEVTFSVADMPNATLFPCHVEGYVESEGYLGIPNLRGFDGTFESSFAVSQPEGRDDDGSVVVERIGEIDVTGMSRYEEQKPEKDSGIIGTGKGKHTMRLSSQGGKAVLFCREPETDKDNEDDEETE